MNVIRARKNLVEFIQNEVLDNRNVSNQLFSIITIFLRKQFIAKNAYEINNNTRNLAGRILADLCYKYQTTNESTEQIWSAVRIRHCQFLSPALQSEVLFGIIFLLGNGAGMERNEIINYLLSMLAPTVPGVKGWWLKNVMQILFRAECFQIEFKTSTKTNLLRLKPQFRSYLSLRMEHDRQLVRIAVEAGLCISPFQWSNLIYGDNYHISYMKTVKKSVPQQSPLNLLIKHLKNYLHVANKDSVKNELDSAFAVLSAFDIVKDNNLWRELPAVLDAIRKLMACLLSVGEFKDRVPMEDIYQPD